MEKEDSYKRFIEHVDAWKENGIPYSISDLNMLARKYGTSIKKDKE